MNDAYCKTNPNEHFPNKNVKWSEELFKIHSINESNVITYKIKDLNDEIIKSIFLRKRIKKN